MTPDIGSVCYFTFHAQFQILNGIYKILAETSFDQAIKGGINFKDTLYRTVGLGEGDYLAAIDQLKQGHVLVLEPVNGDPVVYMPTSLVALIPDPTIREYFPLSLAISLGVHRNTQAILPLLDQINDLVKGSLGITDALQVVTNSANKQYLTDAQYAAIQADRDTRKQQLAPLRVQVEQEKRKNQLLQNKIAYYEALLVHLGQQQP